jgi:hypothetical protein
MKPIPNSLIPIKGFAAINLGGLIFYRNDVEMTDSILRHELIHTSQIIEMLGLFFYIWYGIEWLIKAIFIYGFKNQTAYKNISFEREAYYHSQNLNYRKERKLYSWFKYIQK